MVKASSQVPQHLTSFFYPVIHTSTNTNEPSHIYLLEEGLELWLTLVENSDALNQELLDLSPNALSIIGKTIAVTDTIRRSFNSVTLQNIHPKIFELASASFTRTFYWIRQCIWNGTVEPL